MIILFISDLENFYLDDGCQTTGPDIAGVFEKKSFQAGLRCCSMDGKSCLTPGSCGFLDQQICSDPGEANLMNFDEAISNCTALSRRLCTKNELLGGVCCGTGGCCDLALIWTSTAQP